MTSVEWGDVIIYYHLIPAVWLQQCEVKQQHQTQLENRDIIESPKSQLQQKCCGLVSGHRHDVSYFVPCVLQLY